jgi:two-component system response regulator AtoC
MIRKIILVSEFPDAHHQLVRGLTAGQVELSLQPDLRAAASLLHAHANEPLALVVDMRQCSASEVDLLEDLSVQYPQFPKMVFSANGAESLLNQLRGCNDVSIFSRPLADPCTLGSILETITDAGAPRETRLGCDGPADFERGKSGWQQKLAGRPAANEQLCAEDFLRRVGRSDVPVLLHGETGAGKEVMARKLWSYSNRVGKPFLKLNCAALPSELIESELFGYEKGAFTGAMVDKPGKFELAQDGTILLDEIGDMDTRLQAKLLQVLQDGEVQPLGSSRIVNVNVRIMAATHRDLQAAIAQGSFREDLYYRVSVINITIPPLRERRDEIITLAEKLLARHVVPGASAPQIPETLRRAILAHSWPGNVRELENVMRRFLVYQDAELLAAELGDPFAPPKLRLAVARTPAPPCSPLRTGRVSFDHFAEASRSAESKLLLETLESVRWNRRQAASLLNIDYKALLYKLQKHGIVESKAKRREVSA